jgi:hypothetical protein
MGNPFGGYDPNAGASNNGAGGGYGGGSSDRNPEHNNDENFSYGYGDRAGPDQNNQGYGYGYGDRAPLEPNNQGFSDGYGGQGVPRQGAPGQGATGVPGQNNQGFSYGYGDGSAPPPQYQDFAYGNRDQRAAPGPNKQGVTHGYGDGSASPSQNSNQGFPYGYGDQSPNNSGYNYGNGNGGVAQPDADGYTYGYYRRVTRGETKGTGSNQGGYSYGNGSFGAASSGTPTYAGGSSLPSSGAPEGFYPPERTNYADLQPEQQPQNQAPQTPPHYGNIKTPGRQQQPPGFRAASYLDSMQQRQQPSPRQPPGFGAASYLDGMHQRQQEGPQQPPGFGAGSHLGDMQQRQQQDPQQPPGFGAASYLDYMQERQQDPQQPPGFRAASYLDAMQQRQQQRRSPGFGAPSYLDGVQQQQYQQRPRQPLRPPQQDYSNAGTSRPPQYPGAPRNFPNDRLGPNDPSQVTRTRSIGVDRYDPTVVDVTPADYDNDFAKTAQAQPGFRATNPVPIPVVKGGGNTSTNQDPRSNKTNPNQVPEGLANNKRTFNVDWMGRSRDRSQPPDDPRGYRGESEPRGQPREERWPSEPEPKLGSVPKEEQWSGEPEPRFPMAERWPGEPEPISPLAERSSTPKPKRKNPIRESREIFAQRVEKEDDEKPKFVLWKDIKQEADENSILIGELKSDVAQRKAREAREAMKARERQEQGLPPLQKQELAPPPPPPPGPFEPIRETIPGKSSAFGNRFGANTAETNDGPKSVVFPVQGGPVGPEASWVPPPNVDSNYGKALGLTAPLANAVEQVSLAPFSFANQGKDEATTEVVVTPEVTAEVAAEVGTESSTEVPSETVVEGSSGASSSRQATTVIPPPEDVIEDKWLGLNKPLEDTWPSLNKPPGPEDRVEYWEDTTKPLPVRNPLIDSKWSDSQNQPEAVDSSKFVLWKNIKKNQDENSLLVGAVKRPGAPEPFRGNQNEFPVGLEPSPPSAANKVSRPTSIPGAAPGFAGFSGANWSATSAPSPPAQGSTTYSSTSGATSPNRQEVSSYDRKKSPGFAGFSAVNYSAPPQGPGGQYASPGQEPPQTAPAPPAPPRALTTEETQNAPGLTDVSVRQPPAQPPATSPPASDLSTAGLKTQPNAASTSAPQSKAGPPKDSISSPQIPLRTASDTESQSDAEPPLGQGIPLTSPMNSQFSAAPPKGLIPGQGLQTPWRTASATGLQPKMEPTEGQEGPQISPLTSQTSAAPPKGLSPGPGPQTPSKIAPVTGSQSNTEPTEGQEGPQTSPMSPQFIASPQKGLSSGPKSAASFPDSQRNSTSASKGQQGPQTPPPPPRRSLPDPPKGSSPSKGSSSGPESPPSSPMGSIPAPKSPPQAQSRDSSEIGSRLPPSSPMTVAQRIANSRKDSRAPLRKTTPLSDPGRSSGFSGLPGANFASFRSSSTLLSLSTNSSSEGNASGPPPRFIVPQISINEASQNSVPVQDLPMPAPPPSFGTGASPPESNSEIPDANFAPLRSSPTSESQSTNSLSEGNKSEPLRKFVVPQISSNKATPNPIPVSDPTMAAPMSSFGASEQTQVSTIETI